MENNNIEEIIVESPIPSEKCLHNRIRLIMGEYICVDCCLGIPEENIIQIKEETAKKLMEIMGNKKVSYAEAIEFLIKEVKPKLFPKEYKETKTIKL